MCVSTASSSSEMTDGEILSASGNVAMGRWESLIIRRIPRWESSPGLSGKMWEEFGSTGGEDCNLSHASFLPSARRDSLELA